MKKVYVLFYLAVTLASYNILGQTKSSTKEIRTLTTEPAAGSSFQTYYLPKKVIVVKIKYTLAKTTITRIKYLNKDLDPVIGADGTIAKLVEPTTYAAVIKDPIEISEVIIADAKPYYLDLGTLGKNGKGFKFSLTSSNHGVLTGGNAEQIPATAEIIGGVMGFVTKVISVAAQGISSGIFGTASASGNTAMGDETATTEQIVEVSTLISFDGAQTSATIKPTLIAAFTKVPEVVVSWAPADTRTAATAVPSTETLGIIFRQPAPYKLSINVKNNSSIDDATVFEGILEVPQKGVLTSMPIPIAKGKKTTSFAFDLSSGQLTKFDYNKESGAAAVFSKMNSSTEELGKALIAYEEAKNVQPDPVQAQISALTQQNALLQLQITNEQKKKELAKAGEQ